jgi:rhodanese-related sulfurtransferase
MKSIILLFALLLFTAGCTQRPAEEESMEKTYKQISQEEAMKMMEADDGHIIVDVRRQDEYDAGHIPGAILIPNESIGTEKPEELPDLKQIILVYCRSGRRSKEAAQKLFDMGYTNVFEFGGIIDWTGDVVTETEHLNKTNRQETDDGLRTGIH